MKSRKTIAAVGISVLFLAGVGLQAGTRASNLVDIVPVNTRPSPPVMITMAPVASAAVATKATGKRKSKHVKKTHSLIGSGIYAALAGATSTGWFGLFGKNSFKSAGAN
ncbi:MAG: hypothetical protein KUG65_04470 [Sphingomonadaceae bacterium]|nr:hypothetical protein [Sphingomonadaceae bacterium]